jgi:hypothetical protein
MLLHYFVTNTLYDNMMDNRNYIPVGTEFSKAQMAALSKEFLEKREIFDPRYAGFEENFQWQKYIKVDLKDNILRMRVIGALNQFSDTPEGQHLIRQVGAMEAWRKFHTLTPTHEQQIASILPIIDGPSGHYDMIGHHVWIDRQQIESVEFKGKNGKFHDASIQNVLFHELAHAADGLMTVENMEMLMQTHAKPFVDGVEALFKMGKEQQARFSQKCMDVAKSGKPILAAVDTKEQACMPEISPEWKEKFNKLAKTIGQLQLALISPPTEHSAIEATNKFMRPHYSEPDRILNHAAIRIEDKKDWYTTQPGLGGDHYYDSIKLPNISPKPKKPQLGDR